MADIKIDENKYYIFLNTVKNYVEKTSIGDLENDIKDDGTWMINFIDKELEIRELMLARRSYYDFYIKARTTNQLAANKAYQKYIDAKLEIEKLRGQEK